MRTQLINSEDAALLNNAFNLENSARIGYTNLASIADFIGLDNASKYFKAQSVEEGEHAFKVSEFANKVGFKVEIDPLKMQLEFPESNDLKSLLNSALVVEVKLYDLYAKGMMSPKLMAFCSEMIKIQEDSINEITTKLQRLDKNIVELEIEEELI